MTGKAKRLKAWWSCPECGKRTYPTRADARAVMRLMKGRCEDREGKRLNVYRCCNGWHIGHTTKEES